MTLTGLIVALFAASVSISDEIDGKTAITLLSKPITRRDFILGKFALGLYLGKSAVGSSYGAAGSLVVLLLWVYYSAQILFFGAEFTQVYARTHGSMAKAQEKAAAAAPARPAPTQVVVIPPAPAGGAVKLAAGGAVGLFLGTLVGGFGAVLVVLKSVKKLFT